MTLWPTDRSLHAFTVYRAKGALPKGRACILNQRKLLGEGERLSNSSLVGSLTLPELQWTLTLNARPVLCLSVKSVECTLSGRDSNNARVSVGLEAGLQVTPNPKPKPHSSRGNSSGSSSSVTPTNTEASHH